MNIKFPYSRQLIDQSDLRAVNRALKSRFITQGAELEKFEKEICLKFKCKYSVVVSSGTAALHLSYKVLGVRKRNGILITNLENLLNTGLGVG